MAPLREFSELDVVHGATKALFLSVGKSINPISGWGRLFLRMANIFKRPLPKIDDVLISVIYILGNELVLLACVIHNFCWLQCFFEGSRLNVLRKYWSRKFWQWFRFDRRCQEEVLEVQEPRVWLPKTSSDDAKVTNSTGARSFRGSTLALGKGNILSCSFVDASLYEWMSEQLKLEFISRQLRTGWTSKRAFETPLENALHHILWCRIWIFIHIWPWCHPFKQFENTKGIKVLDTRGSCLNGWRWGGMNNSSEPSKCSMQRMLN